VIFLSAHQADLAIRHLDLIDGPVRDSSKFYFYQGLALQQTGQTEQSNKLLRQLAEQVHDTYGEKARKLLQVH